MSCLLAPISAVTSSFSTPVLGTHAAFVWHEQAIRTIPVAGRFRKT